MASLKLIPPEKRIVFLKNLTAEIMLSIIKKISSEERVKKEKIKQKILEPIPEPKIPHSLIFMPSKFTKEIKKQKEFMAPTIQSSNYIEQIRKPIFHRTKFSTQNTMQQPMQKRQQPTTMQQPMQKRQQPPTMQQHFKTSHQYFPQKQITQQQPIQISPKIKALKEIKPQAQPRPEGFALGKIESLLKDKGIQSIECTGPNKNLLVKKHNKINATRIVLNELEITDILKSFAKQAKIPVIGGILKAAVGNLVVSAVISEFVGSRFIINKITAYNLIQK